ncbi:MAG: phosphoribosylformylglycinamidine synthase subunit PurS [Candidatus Bathyarchaeia archaeon]
MSQSFSVEILISNKPQARDPEGETIIRDLIHKTGFESVKEVRTGKLLTIRVDAANQEDAKDKVLSMCNELRLYNPVAHSVSVRIRS